MTLAAFSMFCDTYFNKSLAHIRLALIVYDTILTLPQEVRCIWQRKWSGVTFLYATIRYVTMLDFMVQLISLLQTPGNTQV